MNKKYKNTHRKDPCGKSAEVEKAIFKFKRKSVITHNAYIQNNRLSRQQGIFLLSGNINTSFKENFQELINNSLYNENDQIFIKNKLYKLTLYKNEGFLKDAFCFLNDSGITTETIFESNLENYCKDLKSRIMNYELLL